MMREEAKLSRLNEMRELLSRLQSLSAAELERLQDLAAANPYPGINIALGHERKAIAAEVEQRKSRR